MRPAFLILAALAALAAPALASIHTYDNEFFYSVGDAYIYRGGREGLYASTKEVRACLEARGRVGAEAAEAKHLCFFWCVRACVASARQLRVRASSGRVIGPADRCRPHARAHAMPWVRAEGWWSARARRTSARTRLPPWRECARARLKFLCSTIGGEKRGHLLTARTVFRRHHPMIGWP